MPISTILSEIEARADAAKSLGKIMVSQTDVPRLIAALRKAVNTLETMGMTETLSHVEKLLGGE